MNRKLVTATLSAGLAAVVLTGCSTHVKESPASKQKRLAEDNSVTLTEFVDWQGEYCAGLIGVGEKVEAISEEYADSEMPLLEVADDYVGRITSVTEPLIALGQTPAVEPGTFGPEVTEQAENAERAWSVSGEKIVAASEEFNSQMESLLAEVHESGDDHDRLQKIADEFPERTQGYLSDLVSTVADEYPRAFPNQATQDATRSIQACAELEAMGEDEDGEGEAQGDDGDPNLTTTDGDEEGTGREGE